MVCLYPYAGKYPCGRCRSCRVNQARTWTIRIVMESGCHAESSFATLTYAQEHLPETGLSNIHWRNLTKGIGYRYFGCGEYGDTFKRPHYHLILFGIGALQAQTLLNQRWPYGFVHVLPLCEKTAAYVARYTVKKYLTGENAYSPDPGKVPEFQRMSRRPALGSEAAMKMGDQYNRLPMDYWQRNGVLPLSVRLNGKPSYVGRTLSTKIRARLSQERLASDELNRAGRALDDQISGKSRDRLLRAQARDESVLNPRPHSRGKF